MKPNGLRLDKGFFFIASESGRDVFAHCSELSPELTFDATLAERRVEFVEAQGQRGQREQIPRQQLIEARKANRLLERIARKRAFDLRIGNS